MGNIFFKFFDPSELSKKRLMYNELYFVSRDEINDPYDINVNKVLNGDRDLYNRIFKRILVETQNSFGITVENNPDPFIQYFIENEISNNSIGMLSSTAFRQILFSCFSLNDSVKNFAQKFSDNLLHFLKSWWNDEVYIVSFSKENDHVLMWSHYAKAHSGFCLVFSAIKNSLSQDHRKIITSIDTSPNVTTQIGNTFQFEPVSYTKNLETLDALMSTPLGISGKRVTGEERREYWKSYRKAFLRKSTAWEYEAEYRLLLPFVFDGLSNRFQRLFHFDVSQLTGLIFGSKIRQEDAGDLIEIVVRLRRDFLNSERYLPPFIFYKATLDLAKYTIKHTPLFVLDPFNKRLPPAEIEQTINNYRKELRNEKEPGKSAQFIEEMEFLRFDS